MNIETSLKKLFSLHTFGIKLGLDNTIGFLNHLGNPQKEIKAIHIAGSNGKGSTASFISSILQEHGYKVGLYTSPHFVRFNERIVINGEQINDEYISSFINEHEKYIDDHQLTFFEVTTAMAFLYFREMKSDFCVIETGLGGRLDATNVLKPLAVVITTISLEHTNVLGNTIQQITKEKAAIIKNGSNVFIGNLKNEAIKIIEKKCKETSSTLFKLNDFVKKNNHEVELIIDDLILKPDPPLRGKFQRDNSALAALTLAKTFSLLNKDAYLKGIENVATNTGLQGRYEYYHRQPAIIFDSAHNPESIESFLREFASESNKYSKRKVIFGAMRDKDIEAMIKSLSNYFDEILLTEIKYERAARTEDIKAICDNLNVPNKVISEPAHFIEHFKMQESDSCLVVLGSMYLLGEIKEKLLERVT